MILMRCCKCKKLMNQCKEPLLSNGKQVVYICGDRGCRLVRMVNNCPMKEIKPNISHGLCDKCAKEEEERIKKRRIKNAT